MSFELPVGGVFSQIISVNSFCQQAASRYQFPAVECHCPVDAATNRLQLSRNSVASRCYSKQSRSRSCGGCRNDGWGADIRPIPTGRCCGVTITGTCGRNDPAQVLGLGSDVFDRRRRCRVVFETRPLIVRHILQFPWHCFQWVNISGVIWHKLRIDTCSCASITTRRDVTAIVLPSHCIRHLIPRD